MVNIENVPKPFREFLETSPETKAKSGDEREISAMDLNAMSMGASSKAQPNDMQDLLFLAAILLLCDD